MVEEGSNELCDELRRQVLRQEMVLQVRSGFAFFFSSFSPSQRVGGIFLEEREKKNYFFSPKHHCQCPNACKLSTWIHLNTNKNTNHPDGYTQIQIQIQMQVIQMDTLKKKYKCKLLDILEYK